MALPPWHSEAEKVSLSENVPVPDTNKSRTYLSPNNVCFCYFVESVKIEDLYPVLNSSVVTHNKIKIFFVKFGAPVVLSHRLSLSLLVQPILSGWTA